MKPFTPAPVKPVVSVDTLKAFDIRVGTISAVSDVPNSDRLVRLTVDFGDHRRQVVAGIKTERADPTEVRGKQALFVLNLEPRRIRGELSEGMLFDIGSADGIMPVLAVPEREVPNGVQAG
jgi:tRNA-binding protein